MQISKRLETVAGMVTSGRTVADIGTDHAYIPIYLIQENRAECAVAMDVNRGPLQRAKEHILQYGLEDRIDTRLSDGLAALSAGEADSVIIAGMGGPLTVRILEEGADRLENCAELILQPQSEIGLVRSYLQEKGWRAERGLAPHAWLIYGAGDLASDADYRAGRFSIQGQSSMLAAEALEVRPGMKVLDACAAPGGKSAYLCEQMQLTGRVYAWELHEKRAQLLEGVRRRLGLDNLRISVRDALDFRPDLEGALDGVLLDAPCAGLGVLSQKPDIKLRLKEEDIPAIVDTQGRLIDTVCRYVRPGGALVYSTCSLLPEENADRVRAFLQAHPNFTLEPLPTSFPEELRARQTPCGLQLLGCRDGVEGFFIARMRRVR